MAFAAPISRARNAGPLVRSTRRPWNPKELGLGFVGETPSRPEWWPKITDSRKEPRSDAYGFPHPTQAEFESTLAWYKKVLRTGWRVSDIPERGNYLKPEYIRPDGSVKFIYTWERSPPSGTPVITLPMGAYREDANGIFLGNAHWTWGELLLGWLTGLERAPMTSRPYGRYNRLQAYRAVAIAGGVQGYWRKLDADTFTTEESGKSWMDKAAPWIAGIGFAGGLLAVGAALVGAGTAVGAVAPTAAAVAPTTAVVPIATVATATAAPVAATTGWTATALKVGSGVLGVAKAVIGGPSPPSAITESGLIPQVAQIARPLIMSEVQKFVTPSTPSEGRDYALPGALNYTESGLISSGFARPETAVGFMETSVGGVPLKWLLIGGGGLILTWAITTRK